MLDISLKSIDKVYYSQKATYNLIEKYDGTKLSVIVHKENVYLAYKGTILNPDDYYEAFKYFGYERIQRESIGDFAYANIMYDLGFFNEKIGIPVSDFIKKCRSYNIKYKTSVELFMELIQRKPTCLRDYPEEMYGKVFIVGLAHLSKVEFRANKIKTTVESSYYKSKELYNEFKKCISDILIEPEYVTIKGDSLGKIIEETKNYDKNDLEGLVVCNHNFDPFAKILVNGQHDKEIRKAKKLRWCLEDSKEEKYFNDIKNFIYRWNVSTKIFFGHIHSISTMNENFNCTSFDDEDLKKNFLQHYEDCFHCMLYFRNKCAIGNHNSLYIGRMQPPTIKHHQLIEHCARQSDNLIVVLTDGAKGEEDKNPYTFEERVAMLPRIEGVHYFNINSGNIFYIQEKVGFDISTIICGYDREESYLNQIKNNPEMEIDSYDRGDQISSTKLRKAIEDKNFEKFKEYAAPGTFEALKHLFETQQ